MKRDGQVVEQLGMAGGWPDGPKLSGVVHQAAAEQVQPDAVDHHAGRQRVVRRSDPVGQLAAGRCRWLIGPLLVVSTCGKPRGTVSPGLVDLAADVTARLSRAVSRSRTPSPAAFGVPSAS